MRKRLVLDSFPSCSCLLHAGNPDQGWVSLDLNYVFNGQAAKSSQLGLFLDSISYQSKLIHIWKKYSQSHFINQLHYYLGKFNGILSWDQFYFAFQAEQEV